MTTAEPQKAKWVKVHDDGPCFDGKMRTVLDTDGRCPACRIHPDMQSTLFLLCCPVDKVQLGEGGVCPRCNIAFDTRIN